LLGVSHDDDKKNIKVYFVLAALFSSFNASSEEIAEKFLVKCYVSLMDGNQTIYFGRLPKQNLQ
jgi:hypothetical protein